MIKFIDKYVKQECILFTIYFLVYTSIYFLFVDNVVYMINDFWTDIFLMVASNLMIIVAFEILKLFKMKVKIIRIYHTIILFMVALYFIGATILSIIMPDPANPYDVIFIYYILIIQLLLYRKRLKDR